MTQAEQELEALRAKYQEPEVENKATLQEVNDLATHLAHRRDEKEKAEEILSTINKEIETTQQRIVDILMENQLTSYKAPAGLLSVSHIFTAKLPQGPDRDAAFAYIKSIGREDMFSIHSATFNSWVKEQYELAKERGEDEPKLPGVTDVKTLLRISFRRSK